MHIAKMAWKPQRADKMEHKAAAVVLKPMPVDVDKLVHPAGYQQKLVGHIYRMALEKQQQDEPMANGPVEAQMARDSSLDVDY